MSNNPPKEIAAIVAYLEDHDGLIQMGGVIEHTKATGTSHVGVESDMLAALLWLAIEGAKARREPIRIRFGT